jgi:hypothetical protein
MEFLFSPSSYKGDFTPESLVFQGTLQEFAQRVSYICELEDNGNISPQEAYAQVRLLFEALMRPEPHPERGF